MQQQPAWVRLAAEKRKLSVMQKAIARQQAVVDALEEEARAAKVARGMGAEAGESTLGQGGYAPERGKAASPAVKRDPPHREPPHRELRKRRKHAPAQ